MNSAVNKSAGVVILRFFVSPSIKFTFSPNASTTVASSVKPSL